MLEAIIQELNTEPIELPRLTVSDTFIHYARMATQFGRANDCLKALPECSSNQATTEQLKELIKACGFVVRSAERLLEANR